MASLVTGLPYGRLTSNIVAMNSRHFLASVFSILCVFSASAQDKPKSDAKPEELNTAWLAEHYTKYEHRIAMRDG